MTFRCAKCHVHAPPASAYLTGEPMCQEHLVEAAEALLRSSVCKPRKSITEIQVEEREMRPAA